MVSAETKLERLLVEAVAMSVSLEHTNSPSGSVQKVAGSGMLGAVEMLREGCESAVASLAQVRD